jgi:cytochrome c oxidase subunit 3
MRSPAAPSPGAMALDVSQLPSHAFGARSPLWWALLLLVAIESTAMGLLIVSYFYLRGNDQQWPPSFAGTAALRLAVIQVVALAVSYPAMVLAVRAARSKRFHATRAWLLIATLLGTLMLVIRAFELPRIEVRWDSNAYGSLFWMIFGVHVTHVLTGVLESAMMLALFYFRPRRVEEKHFGDVEASALLWYLSVLEWIPAFAILYLEPVLRAR